MARRPATGPGRPPFLEIRVRGFHLTVERIPYRLLAVLTTLGGALAGMAWFPR
ncbi:hypothetical protein ACFRJ1_31945 [Streptomyces sp. NPDC056773]|uniref:hypothetical protein n=1 Tax=unclassified Streptomyces TaxID=2593676 RepID=UPI0036CEEFC4